MKKYTIKDKSGTKKIIYAKDLAHALKVVDSKVKDDIDAVRIVGIRYNKYVVMDKTATKVLSPKFNDVDDAYNWIKKNYPRAKVLDSKVKDDANHPKTFKFFINNRAVSEDEYTKSFIKEAAREHQSARTAQRVINEDKESAKVNGKNTFFCESGCKFSIIYDSKVKDEANLPTTIQALVNDEEAAIKAYEVAIKNLEGKIDETQMQVLINIMKDERRHVENLYAILNGKVTEKNLEDSIKDATLEITVKNQSEYSEIDSIAKKLHLSFYETTGNKAILEGSRKDLEEYIDLVWGGDASIKRQIRG